MFYGNRVDIQWQAAIVCRWRTAFLPWDLTRTNLPARMSKVGHSSPQTPNLIACCAEAAPRSPARVLYSGQPEFAFYLRGFAPSSPDQISWEGDTPVSPVPARTRDSSTQ
jgi:hypothetical protein